MDIINHQEIEEIREKFIGIPEDYLDWLSNEGWGEHGSGYMFYSRPSYAKEIFGTGIPNSILSTVLIADDMAGFSIGFDANWRFVGIDSCDWELQIIGEGLNAYIRSF